MAYKYKMTEYVKEKLRVAYLTFSACITKQENRKRKKNDDSEASVIRFNAQSSIIFFFFCKYTYNYAMESD